MISLILIIITSFLFMGVVVRTKSFFSGRKGPGILQPMKDIFRLLKKGSVYSKTTSIIFKLAPTIYFTSVVTAILMIPIGNNHGLISFKGDFVMFAYLLALGKFMNIIAALDTGSSFEGMGSSRESLYSMLAEPAFFIIIGSFTLLTGQTSFSDIFSQLHFGSYISYLLAILATIVIVLIAMVENSRMPFDDPKTHLELTMVHEVMILDNSGFDLGIILYTTNLKFAMYGALIANLFIGFLPVYFTIPIFLGIQMIFAVAVGTIESFMARYRMGHNPQNIMILTSVALLVFFGVLIIKGLLI